MTRVVQTQIDLLRLQDQPPALHPLDDVSDFDANHDASWREMLLHEMPMDVPHQHAGAELITGQLAADPALAPMADGLDERPQFLTGSSRVVFPGMAGTTGQTNDDACV